MSPFLWLHFEHFIPFTSMWVSRRRPGRAFAPRWPGHRYKYPISTPSIPFSSWSYLPSSSDYGFDDQLEDNTSAFHSVSSSRSWKAMGLARGTYVDYVAMKLSPSSALH